MNTRIVFIIAFLAIFLGIVSLTGVFSSHPKPEKVQEPAEPQITFWQAKHEIAVGEPISVDDLVEQNLPLSQAIHFHVTHAQPIRFVSSMVARHSIKAEQVVNPSDIATPDNPDYINLITPVGKVAYPISVKNAELEVMKVKANDYIDVMLLSSPGGNVNQTQSSLNALNHLSVTLLFKAVKVISVPEKFDTDKTSAVLVALDQEQVAKLVIARRIGQIYIYHTGKNNTAEFDDIEVKDVLPGYSAVRELRGSTSSSSPNLQGMSR